MNYPLIDDKSLLCFIGVKALAFYFFPQTADRAIKRIKA
jgi:hypothetical protein